MKKKILFLLFMVVGIYFINAQVPEKFNYQGILRNTSGELIANTNISLQISLLEGSSTSAASYIEQHSATTNDFGQFAVMIGDGTNQSGSVSSIAWSSGLVFFKTEVDENGGTSFKELGTVQLISVPYAMHSNSAENLGDKNIYTAGSDTLFVVKDHDGNVVFAVFPDGAAVYVNEQAKGKVGGFAVSGRNPSKSTEVEYLRVTTDSTRIYVDESLSTKGKVGGFAVSGRNPSKGIAHEYLLVTGDSSRIYVNDTTVKGKVGGFAVSGRNPSKGYTQDYFNISGNKNVEILNPSEARIYWYPKKEAFLTGRVLVESADSVGTNSMATGFESKAIGNYSQAFGYQCRSKGDYSLAIGKEAIANATGSFAFGYMAIANDPYSTAIGYHALADSTASFALGDHAKALGYKSYAFGYNNNASGLKSYCIGSQNSASGETAMAIGHSSDATGNSALAIGRNAQATGRLSTAIGASDDLYEPRMTTASGDQAIAIGTACEAGGINSMALGFGIEVTGSYSLGVALSNQFSTNVSQNNTMAIMGGDVGIGTVTPSEKLEIQDGNIRVTNGSIIDDGTVLSDFVFEPGYQLESIEDHAQFMWKNKHLPALLSAKEIKDAGGYDIVERREQMLEELEKAHIYIEQLNSELKNIKSEHKQQIVDLKSENEQLKQKLNEIIETLSKQ